MFESISRSSAGGRPWAGPGSPKGPRGSEVTKYGQVVTTPLALALQLVLTTALAGGLKLALYGDVSEVTFVAHAEPAAQGGIPVPGNIVGEAHTRRRVARG